MADIQYLNYGDLQIELLALLNNLASSVQSYVLKQPWSKKRKEKFMSAYSDIINRGLLGASNSTGLWLIEINGNLDLNSMESRDREAYQEAAYFIQQQMSSLPTKTLQEQQQVVDKSKLPVFDNKTFTSGLISHIGHKRFGGQDWTTSEWNELDKRGENGLRGTNERAKALAEHLRNYSNSIEEGKYNFEGGPFADLNDFKTRVNTAITELENKDWNLSDKDALNRIGLKASDWFNDGSGDLTTYNGQQISYGQLQELKLKEQQQLQEWLNKNKLTFSWSSPNAQVMDIYALGSKYNGNTQALISKANEYALRGLDNLTPEETSELLGAFRYGVKSPIDEDLHNLIKNSSLLFKTSNINDFEKINGVDGVVLHKPSGRLLGYRTQEQIDFANADFLKGLSLDEQDLLKRANAGKRLMFRPTYNEDGSIDYVDTARNNGVDTARVVALLEDIAAGVAATVVPGYGAAISAGFSLESLKNELIADALDPSVSWGEVGGNVLANLGFTALGLFPFGKFAKSGKWVKTLINMAGPLLGIGFSTTAFTNLMTDPSFKNTWSKIADGSLTSLNVEDTKNVLKGLGAIVGVLQGGRGVGKAIRNHNVYPQISKTHTVTTKNKNSYTLSEEEFNKLNELGNGKDGNAEANKYFNSIIKERNPNAPEETLDFSFREVGKVERFVKKAIPNLVKERFNKNKAPSKVNEKVVLTEKGKEAARINEAVKTGNYAAPNMPIFSRMAARYTPKFIRETVPTDYDIYVGKIGASKLLPQQELPKQQSSESTLVSRILFPNPKKSTRVIKPNTPEQPGKKLNINEGKMITDFNIGDGQKHNYEFDLKNLILKIDDQTFKVKSHNEAKQRFALWIRETLKIASKEDMANHTFTPEFVQAIKNLKRQGILRQGGRIDKLKIEKYKIFINK